MDSYVTVFPHIKAAEGKFDHGIKHSVSTQINNLNNGVSTLGPVVQN